jgi:hypothetical protein
MCTETAQILSGAVRLAGGITGDCAHVRVYRLYNKGSTLIKWAASSRERYVWLLRHFVALLDEYTARYGKRHGSSKVLALLTSNIGYITPSDAPLAFVNLAKRESLGIDFTHMEDVHDAYRTYLCRRWELESLGS